MRVIEAGYKILTPISKGGIEELKHIERIGRVCYKSEDKITFDGESAKKFVAGLIKRGHEAMLEHGSLSVMFTVDRGVTHELVRHRLASFAQESQRYCNYSNEKFGNEITFVRPCYWDKGTVEYDMWLRAISEAEKSYFLLLNEGASPQEARAVLPNSVKADITITANWREWRHILNLRAVGTTGMPHPSMYMVMNPLLDELSKKIPVLFDDIKERRDNGA